MNINELITEEIKNHSFMTGYDDIICFTLDKDLNYIDMTAKAFDLKKSCDKVLLIFSSDDFSKFCKNRYCYNRLQIATQHSSNPKKKMPKNITTGWFKMITDSEIPLGVCYFAYQKDIGVIKKD